MQPLDFSHVDHYFSEMSARCAQVLESTSPPGTPLLRQLHSNMSAQQHHNDTLANFGQINQLQAVATNTRTNSLLNFVAEAPLEIDNVLRSRSGSSGWLGGDAPIPVTGLGFDANRRHVPLQPSAHAANPLRGIHTRSLPIENADAGSGGPRTQEEGELSPDEAMALAALYSPPSNQRGKLNDYQETYHQPKNPPTGTESTAALVYLGRRLEGELEVERRYQPVLNRTFSKQTEDNTLREDNFLLDDQNHKYNIKARTIGALLPFQSAPAAAMAAKQASDDQLFKDLLEHDNPNAVLRRRTNQRLRPPVLDEVEEIAAQSQGHHNNDNGGGEEENPRKPISLLQNLREVVRFESEPGNGATSRKKSPSVTMLPPPSGAVAVGVDTKSSLGKQSPLLTDTLPQQTIPTKYQAGDKTVDKKRISPALLESLKNHPFLGQKQASPTGTGNTASGGLARNSRPPTTEKSAPETSGTTICVEKTTIQTGMPRSQVYLGPVTTSGDAIELVTSDTTKAKLPTEHARTTDIIHPAAASLNSKNSSAKARTTSETEKKRDRKGAQQSGSEKTKGQPVEETPKESHANQQDRKIRNPRKGPHGDEKENGSLTDSSIARGSQSSFDSYSSSYYTDSYTSHSTDSSYASEESLDKKKTKIPAVAVQPTAAVRPPGTMISNIAANRRMTAPVVHLPFPVPSTGLKERVSSAMIVPPAALLKTRFENSTNNVTQVTAPPKMQTPKSASKLPPFLAMAMMAKKAVAARQRVKNGTEALPPDVSLQSQSGFSVGRHTVYSDPNNTTMSYAETVESSIPDIIPAQEFSRLLQGTGASSAPGGGAFSSQLREKQMFHQGNTRPPLAVSTHGQERPPNSSLAPTPTLVAARGGTPEHHQQQQQQPPTKPVVTVPPADSAPTSRQVSVMNTAHVEEPIVPRVGNQLPVAPAIAEKNLQGPSKQAILENTVHPNVQKFLDSRSNPPEEGNQKQQGPPLGDSLTNKQLDISNAPLPPSHRASPERAISSASLKSKTVSNVESCKTPVPTFAPPPPPPKQKSGCC